MKYLLFFLACVLSCFVFKTTGHLSWKHKSGKADQLSLSLPPHFPPSLRNFIGNEIRNVNRKIANFITERDLNFNNDLKNAKNNNNKNNNNNNNNNNCKNNNNNIKGQKRSSARVIYSLSDNLGGKGKEQQKNTNKNISNKNKSTNHNSNHQSIPKHDDSKSRAELLGEVLGDFDLGSELVQAIRENVASSEYDQKYRDIKFNLKKFEEFRDNVSNRVLKPTTVVGQSNDEMANEGNKSCEKLERKIQNNEHEKRSMIPFKSSNKSNFNKINDDNNNHNNNDKYTDNFNDID